MPHFWSSSWLFSNIHFCDVSLAAETLQRAFPIRSVGAAALPPRLFHLSAVQAIVFAMIVEEKAIPANQPSLSPSLLFSNSSCFQGPLKRQRIQGQMYSLAHQLVDQFLEYSFQWFGNQSRLSLSGKAWRIWSSCSGALDRQNIVNLNWVHRKCRCPQMALTLPRFLLDWFLSLLSYFHLHTT